MSKSSVRSDQKQLFSEQLLCSQPLLLAVERIFNAARRSVDSKREAFRGPNSRPFYLSTDSCGYTAMSKLFLEVWRTNRRPLVSYDSVHGNQEGGKN